jgi:hypothetical protein
MQKSAQICRNPDFGGTYRFFLVHRTLKLLRQRGKVRLVLETLHLPDAIASAEDEAVAIADFR